MEAERTIEALTATFLKDQGPALSSARKHTLVQYYMRLLDSCVSPSIVHNVPHLVDMIKKKLMRNYVSSDKALAFCQCYQKLQTKGVLQDPWPILYLLYSVSRKPDTEKAFNRLGQLANVQTAFASLGLDTMRQTPPEGVTSCTAILTHPVAPFTKSTSYPESSLTTSEPQQRAMRCSVPQRPPRFHPLPNESDQPLYSILPRPQGVTEEQLLMDLVFVLQGVEGKYVRWDKNEHQFQLLPQISADRRVRLLVNELAEVGTLYRQVRQFIDVKRLQANQGLVIQSLCAYFEEALREHLQVVALLESQCTQPVESQVQKIGVHFDDQIGMDPTHDGLSQSSSKGGVWSPTARRELSLRRLKIWLQEPLQKLGFLAHLIEQCQNLRGGPLLSMIHGYTDHGDPFTQELARRIMAQITAPFYEILEHWVFNGELLDPHGESFVICNADTITRIWDDKFYLGVAEIPQFIHSVLAAKIFLIGKSLNFLRFHCNDGAWLNQQSRIMKQEVVLKYEDAFAVEVSIDKAYRTVSQRLLDVLFQKYRLMDHFLAMKRYLLLEQGDFAQCLMNALSNELSKPADQLYRHNFNAMVESAIRASNAQYDNPAILRQLDFEILQKSPGDSGWEIFGLKYNIPDPIQQFLPPDSVLPYSKLFVFLWKLKYVEHELSNLWRKQTTCARTLNLPTYLQPELQRCHALTGEMTHFINQLQCFILYELLEKAWDEFNQRIRKGISDLDSLIAAHRNYLQSITAILMNKKTNYMVVLSKMFETIFQFRTTMDNLYDFVLMEKTLGSHQDDAPPERLATLRKQLYTHSEGFKRRLCDLLGNLVDHPDSNLRFLAVRLNFNEVYTPTARYRASSVSSRTQGRPLPPRPTSMVLDTPTSSSRG
ncbi:Microtubule-nucleating Tub4p (gamma-tubulin) complex component [Dispira simplex]|nr:Microtubule-nucleating Tub4p (gamma-tubulin) complex component [Dispira simplex]